MRRANILVMDDGVIKLADFGASRKLLELTGEARTNHILGEHREGVGCMA